MEIEGKSRLRSFVLTLVLGPIGLFYASERYGIILTVIALVSYKTVIGPILCWIFAIAISDFCIEQYNKGLKKFNRMMNISDSRF